MLSLELSAEPEEETQLLTHLDFTVPSKRQGLLTLTDTTADEENWGGFTHQWRPHFFNTAPELLYLFLYI